MFEPEPTKEKNGPAYEKWAVYWHAKFDKENEKQELDIDYMHRRRIYMQRKAEDALRRIYGVQKSDALPDLETL